MTDILLPLDHFNGAPVIRSLEIAPDNIAERRAVELVHYMMRDFGPQESSGAEDYFKEVHANVLDKIQFRYNEFKKWSPEFFPPDYEPDLTALAVAVISDDYIVNLGEPTQDEEGNVSEAQYYGINKRIAQRAIHIYEGGEELHKHGTLARQDGQKSSHLLLERIFLGHLNVLEMLREHEARFDSYEVHDLLGILEKDYPVARKFINPTTDMGDMISNYIDLMQARMNAIVEEAEIKVIEALDNFRASATPKASPLNNEFATAAISIQKYGAEQVPAYFFIDAEESPVVYAAMKYMHSSMKQDSAFEGGTAIDAEQYHTKMAIDFIEVRYCIMENYIDDFFDETPNIAMESIKVAVICDNHIGGLNEPIESPYGTETRLRNDDIDSLIVDEACVFHEEADTMLNRVLPKAAYKESAPESIFIAHVRGLNELMNLQESIEDINATQAKKWLGERIPAIRGFLLPDTRMGAEIISHMEECERTLRTAIEQHEHYMNERYGSMRMVHNNPDCETTQKRADNLRLAPPPPDLAP